MFVEEHTEHGPPGTLFTVLYKKIKDTELGRFFGFDTEQNHLGQYWFEAIMFSIVIVTVLIILTFITIRRRDKVPHGLQNFFEIVVEALNKLITGMVGPDGSKYLPYLGTLFVYIFCMNMLGLIPLFRSPTMTLSTTLALGLTTFIVVQMYAVRHNGIVGYLKHFAGDILWLAPLMFVVHIVGELAKPVSLSLRLYGNIFGEDNVIENLMTMGGWIPLHFPMLLFAVFTSFLQAFIFTSLSSIYIGFMTTHEGGHEGGDKHKLEH